MCPCPGDSGAISTELGRLPRSSRSLRTALRFPSPAVSRTAQLRPCYDQQPRGDDTDRRQGVALARLPSSRRPHSQHECALPNTSLPQYGNESLLWSMFMRKEMILQCPQVTIKSHRSVPNVVPGN
uniref:Uncharacterized protein n=1 Tax=Oryza nivara TaxID=4536 RepID=A0A0E0J0M7_ORYNI